MTAAPTAGDALALVRLAASGAAGALARHASRIDDINVFPVPDGDTGANLSQTARSVLDALQANSQPEPSAIARVGARAALLGARGNSGIILSQLVRGACDRLGEGGLLDGPRVADALRRASTEADAALREPVEGTILTVARALADGAEAARSQDPIETLAAGLASAEAALARTTDMLPSLRAAGVVDAGGAGLVELVRGALAALRGEPVAEAAPLWEHAHDTVAADYDGPRYCTGFLVAGSFPREQLELGSRHSATASWSSATASSCARTSTPTTPALRSRPPPSWETLSGVEISDMHAQRDALAERAGAAAVALEDDGRLADVLAIVDGDGNRVLYASLGARLLLERAAHRRRAARTPSARARPRASSCCRTTRACRSSPTTPRRRRRCPCTSCRRAGSRRASPRSSPIAPTSPRPSCGAAFAAAAAWAGSAEVPGGVNDVAALRDAVGRALAPGSTLVTVLAGATAEQEALEALADWLRVGPPGRRARAARGRTGAAALLRER